MAAFPGRAGAAQLCDSTCSSAQSCTFDGVTNVAQGSAALEVNGSCDLLVSDIGTSGDDGVSQVSLPPHTTKVETHFACPNFSQSEAGDQEVVTVHADVPGGIFYRMTLENVGNGTMEIRPDFSPVGATLYTLTVLNGGTVNRVFTNLSSATFRMQQGDQEEFN